jgi:hypothetical protein
MAYWKHLPAALLLASCGGTPPPLNPAELPPVERTEDWEDWNREANLAKRLEGYPLNTAAIEAAFRDKTIQGCYPNGERFAERLGTDGRFYDARTGNALGQYAIQQDQLCFAYPDNRQACFLVSEDDGRFFFYLPGGYRLAAATTCPIPPGTKGLEDEAG